MSYKKRNDLYERLERKKGEVIALRENSNLKGA